MQWEFMVALIVAIPLIMLPVALVWYLNIGGIVQAIRRVRSGKSTRMHEVNIVGEGRNDADIPLGMGH